MSAVLAATKNRATYWMTVFSQLVKLLDRLEKRPSSQWAVTLEFLLRRAVEQWEARTTAREQEPVASFDANESLTGADLWKGVRQVHADSDAFLHDELEILLLLADSILEDETDHGALGDTSVSADDLLREFRTQALMSVDSVNRTRLLPAVARSRWSKLLTHAASVGEPEARFRFEMALLRVGRALYAMAIGLRQSGLGDEMPRALVAFTLGESELSN